MAHARLLPGPKDRDTRKEYSNRGDLTMNRINIDMLGVRQCDACFPMTLRGTNTRADTKSLDALCWGNPSADVMILKITPDT